MSNLIRNTVQNLLQGRRPRSKVDAVFVFGRAQGDWEATEGDSGVLVTAADLFKAVLTDRIVVPGYDGNYDGDTRIATGYPGQAVWSTCLDELGITNKREIWATNPTLPAESQNTKTEGDNFLALAKASKWSTAAVVMQPHQAARAMMGLVKTMEVLEYQMRIVPVFPDRVNWNKRIHGSQGKEEMPRWRQIEAESDRINRYQQKGDLCSWDELATYLLTVVG